MKNISTILVPQGVEYKAVCRGLQSLSQPPKVMAIPMGMSALQRYLAQNPQIQALTQQANASILLTGLCGSLKPNYHIGDRVIYQACQPADNSNHARYCDQQLTDHLQTNLQAATVTGLTCDRIIYNATEKRHLGQTLNLDVVDMEGSTALDFFSQYHIPISIIRIVSDNCLHDLPNLNFALNKNGQLQTLPLITAMLRQPIAATRLISGSLQALPQLTSTIKQLFPDH